MESHLLQMRGLKQIDNNFKVNFQKSHLLQMRGLKPRSQLYHPAKFGRIFYRCVD